MLPHGSGGSFTELSVTENCRGRGGDGIILRQPTPDRMVNIAHSRTSAEICLGGRQCRSWVKRRNTRREHMSSAQLPTADIWPTGWNVHSVADPDLLILLGGCCGTTFLNGEQCATLKFACNRLGSNNMSIVERTAAGLQTIIPGCERRTLPKSTTRADENGQGLLHFYKPSSLREELARRADVPLISRRGQKAMPKSGLFVS